MDQIKSGELGSKVLGSNGQIDDAELQSALAGMNLVQLKSKIRVDGDFMDNESMLAMGYLEN